MKLPRACAFWAAAWMEGGQKRKSWHRRKASTPNFADQRYGLSGCLASIFPSTESVLFAPQRPLLSRCVHLSFA